MLRKRTPGGIATAVCLCVACNGLLGNTEHDVASAAVDASTDTGGPVPDADGGSTGIRGSDGNDAGASPGGDDGASRQESGTGVDAEAGACASVCTLGSTQCLGGGVQTCLKASDGCHEWGAAVACDGGACVAGACATGCSPSGTTRCVGDGVETCSGGTWSAPVACASACVNDVCSTEPPSCAPGGAGMSNCAAGSGTGSCCTSPLVPGLVYARSYDGLAFTDKSSPASLTAFRLDKYETTVGRFRQFVSAVIAGWLPKAGAGKHTHLNQGNGLNATGGGYEGGWDPSWSASIATTASGWSTNLTGGTWTATAGGNENLPISNVAWAEAYAFCIWDGGFLPSEAEWNAAATGGSEQRLYPWSVAFPPGSTNVSCGDAWYDICSSAAAATGKPIAVGSESPAGDGKWGQSDLAGNMFEWTLDWDANYVTACNDCVDETAVQYTGRVLRGGSITSPAGGLEISGRSQADPSGHDSDVGVRCARIP